MRGVACGDRPYAAFKAISSAQQFVGNGFRGLLLILEHVIYLGCHPQPSTTKTASLKLPPRSCLPEARALRPLQLSVQRSARPTAPSITVFGLAMSFLAVSG